MKRFIDLRGQDTCNRFAWFDTIFSEFETHNMVMAWVTFADFETDFSGTDIERYRRLTPEWAFQKPGEEDDY